jgi:hypothetical protein
MSACSSCNAPIIWARTGSGKPIPLDFEPAPDGNVEFDVGTGVAKSWGSSHVWPDGVARYRAHFSTCPDADEHRRSRVHA